jgi:ankyrin repeat protein
MPVALTLCLLNGLFDPHDSRTGLYASVWDGDPPRVRFLLTVHPHLIDAPERFTKHPLTPLQIAADRNRHTVMKLLIERGADLEGADSREGTPLRIAARNGHRAAAERLLASGATLDLFSAVALDKRDEVERFLRTAAAFDRAKWLADARCAEPGEDVPVLCVAASRGHREMVKLLLGYGADPGAKVIARPSVISDINRKGTVIGLTPAGTSALDFDIPVRKP